MLDRIAGFDDFTIHNRRKNLGEITALGIITYFNDIIIPNDITDLDDISDLDSNTDFDDNNIPNDMPDLGDITGLVTEKLPGVARGEEGGTWREKTG